MTEESCTVPLIKYVDSRFDSADRAVALAQEAADKATALAQDTAREAKASAARLYTAVIATLSLFLALTLGVVTALMRASR